MKLILFIILFLSCLYCKAQTKRIEYIQVIEYHYFGNDTTRVKPFVCKTDIKYEYCVEWKDNYIGLDSAFKVWVKPDYKYRVHNVNEKHLKRD